MKNENDLHKCPNCYGRINLKEGYYLHCGSYFLTYSDKEEVSYIG